MPQKGDKARKDTYIFVYKKKNKLYCGLKQNQTYPYSQKRNYYVLAVNRDEAGYQAV